MDGIANNVNTDEKQKYDEASTYVRISEDRMEAWIYLTPEENMDYKRDDLKDILKAYGVNAGFHDSNLAAIIKKKIFFREVLAAVGTPAKDGVDGRYEFAISTENYLKNPKINPDGSVDYRSMNLLENIEKGQLIAQYFPAVPGEDGVDVCGKPIPARAIKELPQLKGKGISPRDAENKIYALEDGKIAVKDNEVEIRTVHEVNGDVDYITGFVDFNGDLMINGNVGRDVTIRAGKTVTITGTVESAHIEAGGDVILKCGIQGNEKAMIISGGNVYADFIEQSNVTAKGTVQANSIVNCTVEAGEKVILTGKKGILLGGHTHALRGVEAACLGNDAELRTEVAAGIDRATYLRRSSLTKQITEIDNQLEAIVEEIDVIEKQQLMANESSLNELKLNQIKERKQELEDKKAQTNKEYEEVSALIESCQHVAIRATGNIHRGVMLTINNGALMIERSTSYMNYKCISGEIEGMVIIQS